MTTTTPPPLTPERPGAPDQAVAPTAAAAAQPVTEGGLVPPPHGSAMPSSLRPSLRWHESWIIRAALMASFILMLGFTVSAYFAFESIDAIARMAHDDEIEATLAAHMDSIKRVHELEQALVVERLEDVYRDTSPANEEAVRRALIAAGISALATPIDIKIDATEDQAAADEPPFKWVDRDHLRLPGWSVELPKGPTYAAFKAAEEVKRRYQLVGVKMTEEIRPTLIQASVVVLVGSFLLLASIFFLYAQRFRARTFEVIDGFSIWSEKDAKFRFDPFYKGELKLITDQFNSMADEVEANRQKSLYLEKIASWQIIARKLAHEIKNPLTPIQMMVSQLKRRYKGGDDPEFARLLDEAQTIITEEVAGLRRMVDTFSNFARLPQPSPRPSDLVALGKHVVELDRQRFPQHELVFKADVAKAVAHVDDDLIRQVLINLVKNAGEAAGETPAKITVGVEEAGPDYAITVTDTGPGIPPEHLERVFEAYFTTKHTGPNPGMGLGLAVCQKIVMDHGGTMAVRSRAGQTVFTIKLPRRKKTD
jgi:signal transduction histidine kinase